jgi:hypothetical protein
MEQYNALLSISRYNEDIAIERCASTYTEEVAGVIVWRDHFNLQKH